MIFVSCLATLATLIVPIIFPGLRLFYFAPFLIMASYEKKQTDTLWIALFCGLMMDLFSSGTRIGLIALTFLLSTLFICQLKRYFFKDRLSTLPVMTFLFSCTLAILQLSLNLLFQRETAYSPLSISWNWAWWNVIALPVCDAIFAFALCLTQAALRLFTRHPHLA